MPDTIKLTKVNIGPFKYYSTFKVDGVVSAQEVAVVNLDETNSDPTWVSSSKCISFATPSGNLSDNQYATQTNGYHWVKIPGYTLIKIFPEHIKNNTLSLAGIDYIKFWGGVE